MYQEIGAVHPGFVSLDCRRSFALCFSRPVLNDGAGVLTFTNFATRIEGFDLDLAEFAFHAEERGLGGYLGVIGRGCKM